MCLVSIGGLILMPRRNVLSDAVFQQLLMLNDNYVCHEYWTLDDIITCRKTGCVVVFKSNLTSYTGGCLAFVMSSHSLFNFHSEGRSDFDWFLSFFCRKKGFWFQITLRLPIFYFDLKSLLVLHAVVLVLQVWCCVVKHGLVTLAFIMILKDTATFQVLFIVSLFCVWNITTVEINSGIHLLKS